MKVRRTRDAKGRFKKSKRTRRKNPEFRQGPGGPYPLRGTVDEENRNKPWGGVYLGRKAGEPQEYSYKRK